MQRTISGQTIRFLIAIPIPVLHPPLPHVPPKSITPCSCPAPALPRVPSFPSHHFLLYIEAECPKPFGLAHLHTFTSARVQVRPLGASCPHGYFRPSVPLAAYSFPLPSATASLPTCNTPPLGSSPQFTGCLPPPRWFTFAERTHFLTSLREYPRTSPSFPARCNRSALTHFLIVVVSHFRTDPGSTSAASPDALAFHRHPRRCFPSGSSRNLDHAGRWRRLSGSIVTVSSVSFFTPRSPSNGAYGHFPHPHRPGTQRWSLFGFPLARPFLSHPSPQTSLAPPPSLPTRSERAARQPAAVCIPAPALCLLYPHTHSQAAPERDSSGLPSAASRVTKSFPIQVTVKYMSL